jgi:hypothetical protein
MAITSVLGFCMSVPPGLRAAMGTVGAEFKYLKLIDLIESIDIVNDEWAV